MTRRKRPLALALICLAMLLAPAASLAIGEGVFPGEEAEIDEGDLFDWESFYSSLPEETRSLFGLNGISDFITKAISLEADEGEAGFDATLGGAKRVALEAIRESFAAFSLILVTAVLAGLMAAVAEGSDGAGGAAQLICFAVAASIAAYRMVELIRLSNETIDRLSGFMDIAAPLMSTLLVASGHTVSAAMVNPMMLFLTDAVSMLIKGVVLPIVVAGGVAAIIGSLSESGKAKLESMFKLTKSAAKWLIGAVFTLYLGIVSVRGFSSGMKDSVSIRAARYALDKGIPIIGSAVSGTLDSVLASTALIKNAVGMAGVITVAAVVLSPLLTIAASGIACRIVAALAEPLGDARISKLMGNLADTCTYLFAAVMATALMFLITIGIIMSIGSA